MRGKGVTKAVGYPDEMQARQLMIEEMYRLGTWKEFAAKVGLSRRYLNLIMEWQRPPTHWKLLQYFNWNEVFACAEDLIELEPPPSRRRGRPPLSILEKIDRQLAKEINFQEQRAYWRQKQRESRERRKLLQQVHSI